MAGLLSDVLPFVYSRADALKRRVGGLLSDPMGTLTQAVNDANDRAGGLLSQTRAATKEGLNYGPATQSLAQSIAAAYNPIGITVYHGSPHKFAKFDSSKIGTGEGAQAYGHGLYLAESPDVATRYRDTLTNFRPDHIEAKLIDAGISPEFANTYSQFAAQTKGGARGLDDFAELMGKPGPSPYIEQFRQRIRAELPAARKAADAIAGSLYKVDLPDSAVARMLDWDKPLSQQAPEVQAALSAEAQKYINRGAKVPDAGMIVRGMQPVERFGGSSAVSEMLRQQGIPGIRYLDGGSRGLGSGTSNFVIFPGEESLLTILERNGAPVR